MIVQTTSELARLIRARRRELRLSQEALADLTGVHRTHIGMLEQGERMGKFETVLRVVHALGMDVEIMPRER
jgi:transcriptional regulator with XRE-family HTH domain